MKKETCQPERGFREKIRDPKFRAKMKNPKIVARWLYDRLSDLTSRTVLTLFSRILFFQNRSSWANTVRGKKIVIVGPAPHDRDYSDVIESHDLIIRVGFEHWPWPGTGTRTDVWLLDGQSSREYLDFNLGYAEKTAREGEADPGELERVSRNVAMLGEDMAPWVILKCGTRLRLSEVFKFIFFHKIGASKTRCIISRKPLFMGLRGLDPSSARMHPTALNQVHIALLELFELKPKSVAVFGSDYYTRPGLSYHPTSPSYQLLVGRPDSFIKLMYSAHPQLNQKRIARWIQERRGWPTGDPVFSQLTAMDEDKFLNLYRDWDAK